MAERTADVQAHWTRPGVLARIDAALTELGHDPQKLNPEILATVEHLHSGGLATTREQAKRIALTEDSRVLDVGCGIGGPARYLAHSYGCRVDGIDLTAELIETGRMLTERCGLADRVVLQIGNALDLPYPDQTFDVVWCQNVAMNVADKAGLLAGVYRVLKPGGLFTSTEYSVGPGGDIIFPVPWASDASIETFDDSCLGDYINRHYGRHTRASTEIMSDEFDGLDATEKGGIGAALNRYLVRHRAPSRGLAGGLLQNPRLQSG
jgi:SAM-dependent methyltransferase